MLETTTLQTCEKCGEVKECYFIFLKHICIDCNLDLEDALEEAFEEWFENQ